MLQLDTRLGFRAAFAAATCSLMALAPSTAGAARVAKSNATSVIIDLEGAEMKAGDRAYLLDGSAKKAIVQISKVQNGKALGKILKGSAQVGYDVQPAPAGGGGSKAASERRRGGRSRSPQMIVGALLGYSMDSQTVKASNSSGTVTDTVSMSGSGFSGKGLVDLPISGSLGLIGRFGAETFNITGSSTNAICAGTRNCKTSITYVSADLLLRYSFMKGDFVPYVAGGLGLHFPLSKSSNILDENQISTTTIFFGGGGFYWKFGENSYLPVHVEYGFFPPSNSVNTNIIAARVGYAMTL